MNEMRVFNFNGADVRTQMVNDEPMFCLSDVCKVLDLTTPAKVKERLNEKGTSSIHTPTAGGVQSMTYISEQNLYKVIFQSRKPKAEQFTDWVTGEVLPAIRKTGGYMVSRADDTPEGIMARAVLIAQQTIERQKAQINAANEQLKLQAPDVEYCRNVLASSTLMTVNTIAAHLGISAKRLNAFLDGEGWIYRQGRNWCPSAKIRDRGYCDYTTVPYLNRAGEECTAYNLKWTESGRRAVIELWNRQHNIGGDAGLE